MPSYTVIVEGKFSMKDLNIHSNHGVLEYTRESVKDLVKDESRALRQPMCACELSEVINLYFLP